MVRMSAGDGLRRGWGMPGAAVALLVLVAACDGSGQGSDGSGSAGTAEPTATVATTDVSLPAGDEPVVVTPWGEDLLVGSRAPEGSASRPRLTVLTAAGSHEVPVTPVSPTAFQTKWLVAAPRGAAVDLVGGAPAGAHSNTRWFTWRGDASGVRELPQPFATFGGWGAGALVSLVQTPSAPVVVGSWESGGAGPRHRPVAPEGRAVGARLLGGHAAGEHGHRPGVGTRRHGRPRRACSSSGSVTLLGDGSVTQRPAVWRSPGPDGPWTRTDLPGDGVAGGGPRGRLRRHRPVHRRRRGRRDAARVDRGGRRLGDGPRAAHARRGGARPAGLPAARFAASPPWCWPRAGRFGCSPWAVAASASRPGHPLAVVRSAARTGTGDYVVLEDPAGAARLVRLAR